MMETVRSVASRALSALTGAGTQPAAVSPARAIKQGQGQFRQIALTFDTEFHAQITPDLLDVLDANMAKSTFFLVGKEISPFNTLTRRIAAAHEVGNHTYYHSSMTHIPRSEQLLQIRMADTSITAEVGKSPKPYFRPPFGDYDDGVLEVCGLEGYPFLLHWSMAPDETATVDREVEDIISQAFAGGIALFHGWTPNTPRALERALPVLRRQGYQFVTISEILGFGRGERDWGGTPIHVQTGDTFESLAPAYNTTPGFLAAYNELSAEPEPGRVLMCPHRDEVMIRVNGARLDFDVYPRIEKDLTLVPVRPVCEYAGAAVTWRPTTRQVLVELRDKRILLTLDSDVADVNGVTVPMPAAARNMGGRTVAPLRFLSEALGFPVAWDGFTRTVSVTAT